MGDTARDLFWPCGFALRFGGSSPGWINLTETLAKTSQALSPR